MSVQDSYQVVRKLPKLKAYKLGLVGSKMFFFNLVCPVGLIWFDQSPDEKTNRNIFVSDFI